MTVTAQFAAPVARVWAAYADPGQLERARSTEQLRADMKHVV